MAEDQDKKLQDKKIKEIEATLKRELDQDVQLFQPLDSRVEGSVEVNPTLNLTPKPPSLTDPKAKAAKVEINYNNTSTIPPVIKNNNGDMSMSFDDLDALIKKEMPEFENELSILREAGKDLIGKNINLSESDFTSELEQSVSDELPKKLSLFSSFKKDVQKKYAHSAKFLTSLPVQTHKYLIKFLKEDAKKILGLIFAAIKTGFQKIRATVTSFTKIQKLIVFMLLCILGGIGFLLKTQISFTSLTKDPYHENFANYSQGVEFSNKTFVPLSEEGLYPEFVVLLDKVIVNIKPSESSSQNPMVAVRLYFEVTSREAAIEMKDREKEMRDIAQRVLEEFNYDQIVTASGKQAFKEGLRREMSAILNTGLVKNVYIDDILMKP